MIAALLLGTMLAQARHPPRTSTICRNLTRKRCWRVTLAADCRGAEVFRTVAEGSVHTDVNVALADCEASLSDHEPTGR